MRHPRATRCARPSAASWEGAAPAFASAATEQLAAGSNGAPPVAPFDAFALPRGRELELLAPEPPMRGHEVRALIDALDPRLQAPPLSGTEMRRLLQALDPAAAGSPSDLDLAQHPDLAVVVASPWF